MRTPKISLALVLAAAAGLLAFAAWRHWPGGVSDPARDTARFVVRVLDQKGAPVPGASVTIESAHGLLPNPVTKVTNASGIAMLAVPAGGGYKAKVEYAGYETSTLERVDAP